MSDYLKFIPTIFSSPTVNAIVLTIIPAIFYTLAAYGHTFFKDLSLGISIFIAIVFAAIEYIFRIPINQYASKEAKLSNGQQQTIWMLLTLALGWASDLLVAT